MQLEHHTAQLRNAVLQPIRKARGVILNGAPIDEEEERAVAEEEARRREDFDEVSGRLAAALVCMKLQECAGDLEEHHSRVQHC